MVTQKKCIVLISSISSSKEQENNTRNLNALLDAKKIKREYVDGAQDICREKRNELFQVSGIRGKYPQVFLQHGDTMEFFGLYPKLQELNELSDVPLELLEQNQLKTLDMLLVDVEKV